MEAVRPPVWGAALRVLLLLACCSHGTSSACVDDPSWQSQHGDCHSYSELGINRGFCKEDGAEEPCPLSCGVCGAACPPIGGGFFGEGRYCIGDQLYYCLEGGANGLLGLDETPVCEHGCGPNPVSTDLDDVCLDPPAPKPVPATHAPTPLTTPFPTRFPTPLPTPRPTTMSPTTRPTRSPTPPTATPTFRPTAFPTHAPTAPPLGSLGGKCTRGAGCDPGLTCSLPSGTCRLAHTPSTPAPTTPPTLWLGGAGGACTRGGGCDLGLTCDPDTWVCEPPVGTIGGSCTLDGACDPGLTCREHEWRCAEPMTAPPQSAPEDEVRKRDEAALSQLRADYRAHCRTCSTLSEAEFEVLILKVYDARQKRADQLAPASGGSGSPRAPSDASPLAPSPGARRTASPTPERLAAPTNHPPILVDATTLGEETPPGVAPRISSLLWKFSRNGGNFDNVKVILGKGH